MNQHPYWRAYMAGITVPTIFLLIAMTGFTIARYVCNVPVPIERVVVFPMAVVPNLWGIWNVIWLASRRPLSIGLFGAILPFLLLPGAWLITHLVGFEIPAFVPQVIPFAFPVALAIYYLAWKYLVAALNRIVAIAT